MVPADAPCALRCRFVRMGLRLWRCIAPMGQTDGWRTMWMRNTMGDGGRCGEATADGRLYNRSPRLACLPGVGC